MKTLEKGQDKIKKICKVIKAEALEPAEKEAAQIIASAKEKAEQLLHEAKVEAEELIKKARQENEKQKNVFESTLSQASKQVLASLRQQIENELFQPELTSLLSQISGDPKTVAQMTNAIVEGIEKQGIESDLEAYVSGKVSSKAVNALLLKGVASRLKGEGVSVGSHTGGVQVKIVKENVVIDLSQKTLEEMVAKFVKEDFHKALYGGE